uniref:Uncharacterized protein n=1 Tax=Arundo donax TaxID=35708 RepID=A0A0A9FKY0_ARUDO
MLLKNSNPCSTSPPWLQALRTLKKVILLGLIPALLISANSSTASIDSPCIAKPEIIDVHDTKFLLSSISVNSSSELWIEPILAYKSMREFPTRTSDTRPFFSQ